MTYAQCFLSPSNTHIKQATFLIESALNFAPSMRQEALLDADNMDMRELQSFSCVQGDENDLVAFFLAIFFAFPIES